MTRQALSPLLIHDLRSSLLTLNAGLTEVTGALISAQESPIESIESVSAGLFLIKNTALKLEALCEGRPPLQYIEIHNYLEQWVQTQSADPHFTLYFETQSLAPMSRSEFWVLTQASDLRDLLNSLYAIYQNQGSREVRLTLTREMESVFLLFDSNPSYEKSEIESVIQFHKNLIEQVNLKVELPKPGRIKLFFESYSFKNPKTRNQQPTLNPFTKGTEAKPTHSSQDPILQAKLQTYPQWIIVDDDQRMHTYWDTLWRSKKADTQFGHLYSALPLHFFSYEALNQWFMERLDVDLGSYFFICDYSISESNASEVQPTHLPMTGTVAIDRMAIYDQCALVSSHASEPALVKFANKRGILLISKGDLN